MGFFDRTSKERVKRKNAPGDEHGTQLKKAATDSAERMGSYLKEESKRGVEMTSEDQTALFRKDDQARTDARRQGERQARGHAARKGSTGGQQLSHQMAVNEMMMRSQVKEEQDKAFAVLQFRQSESMKMIQMSMMAFDAAARASGTGQVIESQSSADPSFFDVFSSFTGMG